MVLALTAPLGCSRTKARKAAAAPATGVVGKILRLKGTVTYSLGPKGERKPLQQGMDLRAEWIVHTGPEAELTAQLSNGHRWTLSGDLSKRVSKIHALTLAPAKEGAVAQLTDLGTRHGKDRSAAAGLHQERTAGSKAAPSQVNRPVDKNDLHETTPPGAPPPRVSKQRKGEPVRKTTRRRARRRARSGIRTRSAERHPGMEGTGTALPSDTRGGGAMLRAEPRMLPTPNRAPQPTVVRRPASGTSDAESLPTRLTPTQIRRILSSLRAPFIRCLKEHKVTTAVSLRIVIQGKSGRVTSVRALSGTGGNALVRCLLSHARTVRFPRFSDATQITRMNGLRAR